MLIDDLQLTPLDPPEPAKPQPAPGQLDAPMTAVGKVAMKVDEITKPGTLVSGTVTFSDGGKAAWYLDQTGRLGMNPETPNYRPPEPDINEFQIALDKELTRLGI